MKAVFPNTVRMKTKECTKVKFVDEVAAEFYITKLKKTSMRKKTPLRAYLCPFCSSWHLTSRPDYIGLKQDVKNDEIQKLKERHRNQLTDRDNRIKSLERKLQKAYDRNFELNQQVMAYQKQALKEAISKTIS